MRRYWVIAPYSSKNEEGFEESWSFDLKNDVIAIGWSKLGDVSLLSDTELMEKIKKEYPNKHIQRIFNTLKIVYGEIKENDIVIARKGRKTVVGVGEVSGSAFYDLNMGKERYSGQGEDFTYSNFLRVKWQERYIDFEQMVFGMQTIQQISDRKYNALLSGNYEKDNGEEDYEEGQEYEIPLSERKIITQPSEPTINSLVDKIDKGKLAVRSFFQRKYVWEKQPIIKSRLIESVILNVPIPIVYTAEDEQTGKMNKYILRIAGVSQEDIEKLDAENMDADEVMDYLQKRLMNTINENGNRQRVVHINEVENYIQEGWEYVNTLPEDKGIVRLPL